MDRRDFIRVCATGMAAGGMPAPLLAQGAAVRFYGRAKLVDSQDKPLSASALPVQKNLIFQYPFASTLKTATNQAYEWKGGTGPTGSIVAYSAICAHQLAYPTREISFISFRAESSARNKFPQVIHCCAEHSQYDPAQGGRVLAGPAPQPLAAILLEHDPKSDELFATGTLGGEMFNQFFAKFEFKLAMEHGETARKAVTGTTVVSELDNYCRQQVRC